MAPSTHGWSVDALQTAIERQTVRVDAGTARAIAVLTRRVVTARLLVRVPSLLLWVLPWPFELVTLVAGAFASGWQRIAVLVVGVAMVGVSAVFGRRRQRILRAVSAPEKLAEEFATAIALTGRVGQLRGTIEQAAGAGGLRILSRLRGFWRTISLPETWMDEVGDLPHARYFLPPRLATTWAMTLAALWLIPISVLVAAVAVLLAIET